MVSRVEVMHVKHCETCCSTAPDVPTMSSLKHWDPSSPRKNRLEHIQRRVRTTTETLQCGPPHALQQKCGPPQTNEQKCGPPQKLFGAKCGPPPAKNSYLNAGLYSCHYTRLQPLCTWTAVGRIEAMKVGMGTLVRASARHSCLAARV